MIYNYTKCESVIAKVMADLNISEKNIRITDIREWIFEAVDKIGAPMQYIQKESGSDGEPIIKIEDYQAPIPAGLQSLDTVAYSRSKDGKWEYVRSNTSAFRNRIKDCKCNCFPNMPEQPSVPEQSNTKSKRCQINTINNLDESLNYHSGDVTYFIKPGWIVTNRKDGYLKISYKKIITFYLHFFIIVIILKPVISIMNNEVSSFIDSISFINEEDTLAVNLEAKA